MSGKDQLLRVDRLSITFLVDNTIEWMTKMPPEFKHEIRQHLSKDPPIDDCTGVPFVDLENYCCGAHGFSALIETKVGNETHSTLFDTGPDSKSLVRNLAALKVSTRPIERVILSHWHADHSGGLLSFLKYRLDEFAWSSVGHSKDIPIDLHPDRPIARGIAPGPSFDKVIARLPADPTFEEIEALGATVDLHPEDHVVSGRTVFVSGEIPRVTDFEAGLLGGMRWVEDNGKRHWKSEQDIMDERYALIDVKGKGLVIFTACSHAGVINVVRDAVSKFPRPVYMIIGGLHLAPAEFADRIAPTTNFLRSRLRPAPAYILPMHCSGFNAKVALKEEFGDGCVPAGTGISIDIHGDEEFDKRLPESLVV